MKILETQSAILTNHEVLAHLNALHERYSSHPDYLLRGKSKDFKTGQDIVKAGGRLTEFREVVEDVQRYLSHDTPNSRLGAQYTPQSYRNLMTRLLQFNLTKPELINIINIRPKNAAELEPCIEELDQRLKEEEVVEVLEIIGAELGRDPEEGGDEAVAGEKEDENMVVDG